MSEPAYIDCQPKTTAFCSENLHGIIEQASTQIGGSKRKQQSQQPRQLLSCTKCRERKVKCDRTKPCSACCARGVPKDCHFIAEGGDYAPIQQSYELRKLRTENLRLKERLRSCKIPIVDDESDRTASPDSQPGGRLTGLAHKRRAARQRRFQGSEWSDSIYFGSPGLANIITDFANLNLAPMSIQSLAHLMPRGSDMYTTKNPPPHPFATLFKATPDECIPEMLSCLPAKDELLGYLDSFEKRVNVCAFPHVPMEITRSEVERFLSDARKNAQMCPDMLALLFAALALGSQYSAWDKSGGQWKADTMQEELQRGNVYIAAAMQALRMASFMHKPTLLGIQALIMIGPFLTNSGRFLDAWTLFGTTIRLAQSIGLHRHPKYLDPAPPTQRECSIRQTLWWWMLHMDQEYSMTLGRPLGISGIGDCPPPHELTTDPRMLRFGEFVNHFTVLARQILSSDRLNNAKIDEFTDLLKGLLDTMPEMLQFNDSWLDQHKEVPEWPLGAMAAVFYCKTHTYLILLNRQRIENFSHPRQPSYFHPVNASSSSHSSPSTSPTASLRGRALVLSSSEDLLTAFYFFYTRMPAALICWTMGQQAFNSCMILLLDAMETGDVSRIRKVDDAYAVFQQLQRDGVHELASMAVDKVSWGLVQLGKMQNQPDTSARAQPMMSTREVALGCDVEMQGVAGSEATQGVRDTVMGNTGMLLLEDPGLHSFVSEAFAPLTWTMGGDILEGASRPKIPVKEEQVPRRQVKQNRLDDAKSIEVVSKARSSEQMQGTQGSALGSARYTTCKSAQEQPQPQGLTSPISPQTSAGSMEEHHHHIHGIPELVSLHQPPPPHLRHHSYPCLRQPPAPLVSSRPWNRHYGQQHADQEVEVVSGNKRQGVRRDTIWGAGPEAAELERKMTQSTASQTFLQCLPDGNAASSAMAHPICKPDVRPSWAARPAVPMAHVSEPAMGISRPSSSAPVIPTFAQQEHLMPTWQQAFPFHMSSANNESAPAIASTRAEQCATDGWAGWLGSSGPG